MNADKYRTMMLALAVAQTVIAIFMALH